MAYITGSITDANPGPALHTLMAPALTTAGFALVDTVVISTRTHKIWKSPAASNAANLDWYLDIAYTTAGAGSITFTPFEYFDPATDNGTRGLVGNTTSLVVDATTFSRFGATAASLEHANWMGAHTTYMSTNTTTGAYSYWFSATADRVIFLGGSEPSALSYCGLYTPDPLYAAKAGAGLFPLCAAKLVVSSAESRLANASSAGVATGSLTRVPPITALGGQGWAAHVGFWMASESAGGPMLPSEGVGASAYTAFPIVVDASTLAGSSAGMGVRYGILKDTAYIAATAGLVARGDSVTIAGVSWVLTTVFANRCLLFKAV